MDGCGYLYIIDTSSLYWTDIYEFPAILHYRHFHIRLDASISYWNLYTLLVLCLLVCVTDISIVHWTPLWRHLYIIYWTRSYITPDMYLYPYIMDTYPLQWSLKPHYYVCYFYYGCIYIMAEHFYVTLDAYIIHVICTSTSILRTSILLDTGHLNYLYLLFLSCTGHFYVLATFIFYTHLYHGHLYIMGNFIVCTCILYRVQ